MKYPKKPEENAAYQCGHTLHLTKTAHNCDEEECFVCWMYNCELCPDCKEENARKYREVYAAIENPGYNYYSILFKRQMPIWNGSMLFEEMLENYDKDADGDGYRTTKFLVEYDINHHGDKPVGLYSEDHFVPFGGYTPEYMQFLLRHDREAVQAEKDLRDATVDNWKKYPTVWDGCVIPPGMKGELDDQTLYTKVNIDAWGL